MRELTLDRLPNKVLSKLDMETVFKASRCVLAAEKLIIFRKLHNKEMSAADICRRTGIRRRYGEAFFDFLVFLGLLKKKDGLYRNSPLAERHFIRERSIDWTRLWSGECIKDYEALTVLEDVITGDKGWRELTGSKRKPDYELAREDPEWARGFTYALYDVYQPDAEILAKHLNLSNYHRLLDVGGGSGVMSFALVRKYPHLEASVLDFKFVCAATDEIIRKERLSGRVKTISGDMNKSIPSGFDVIMFWNIGHVDNRVIKMAYDVLPEGGMLVRSCLPPVRPKEPSRSAFLRKYLSVRPTGQTKSSKIESLKESGFRAIKYRRLSSELGVITGLKGRPGK
jgi:ubiquinone/menaquinone biosynthesis C-methylase UbiE